MVVEYPCSVCLKCVKTNDRAIYCDICKKWVHIKCNQITPAKYKEMQNETDSDTFICITCIRSELPFGFESNECLKLTIEKGLSIESNLENIDFNISRNERKTINQISQLVIENTDPENENNDFCKYYNINEFCKKKFVSSNKLSTFHLNIHSLQYHMEDLKMLLNSLEYDWDAITISESKLKKNIPPVKDINLENYQYEHTPTEANKGGTLIYIANKHNYKPRKDLEIYDKSKI